MATDCAFRERRHERGLVIIELAIVVPIVVFMGFCAIEFTRILRISQAISAIGREIGNEAFRTCSSQVVVVDALPSKCLEEVVKHVRSQVSRIINNTTAVNIRMYEMQKVVGGTTTLWLNGCYTTDTSKLPCPATTFPSRASTHNPTAGSREKKLKDAVEAVSGIKVAGRAADPATSVPVVAPVISVQVINPYAPVGPVRDWKGKALLIATDLYDATIL